MIEVQRRRVFGRANRRMQATCLGDSIVSLFRDKSWYDPQSSLGAAALDSCLRRRSAGCGAEVGFSLSSINDQPASSYADSESEPESFSKHEKLTRSLMLWETKTIQEVHEKLSDEHETMWDIPLDQCNRI